MQKIKRVNGLIFNAQNKLKPKHTRSLFQEPNCFSDIEKQFQQDKDYKVTINKRSSSIAIVAPHGGKIELGTSEIAHAIAKDKFNLYLFEGLLPANNYSQLHLTSRKFNDPHCLNLIASCKHVITIHGCKGNDKHLYLGGRDNKLIKKFTQLLNKNSFDIFVHHHEFPGLQKMNICNRGLNQAGVQIEISKGLRVSDDVGLVCDIIHDALLEIQNSE